jgi:hypothetical protein
MNDLFDVEQHEGWEQESAESSQRQKLLVSSSKKKLGPNQILFMVLLVLVILILIVVLIPKPVDPAENVMKPFCDALVRGDHQAVDAQLYVGSSTLPDFSINHNLTVTSWVNDNDVFSGGLVTSCTGISSRFESGSSFDQLTVQVRYVYSNGTVEDKTFLLWRDTGTDDDAWKIVAIQAA